MRFLRFCKQHGDGVWVVVDVSVDAVREGPNAHTFMHCRRLPSGCIVQDMPNGYSKVTDNTCIVCSFPCLSLIFVSFFAIYPC